MNNDDTGLTHGGEADRTVRMSMRSRIAWKAAEMATVTLAGVLMFTRYGLGFVCVGVAALLVGVVIVSAVLPFIRRPLLRRKVSLIMVAGIASLAVGFAYYETASTTLFRRYVADPIPASVRILESEYQGGLDSAVYLYFELSPDDLDAVLRTRPYANTRRMDGPLGTAPAWWKPDSLANPTVYYREDQSDAPQHATWLWVNETKTKAYFTHWNF